MAGRSKSSGRWLKEHFNDQYVKRAQAEGWRSRAVFKLLELDAKDRLLRPGSVVVDLGAAPGGWTQAAVKAVGKNGTVIGLDILPMEPVQGATLIEADFTLDEGLVALEKVLDGKQVDLVLSDMAPNSSGMVQVDQPRSMNLVELAVDFALHWLRPGGTLVMKVFQGTGFDELIRNLRGSFVTVVTRKPEASRPRSREVYVVAKKRKP